MSSMNRVKVFLRFDMGFLRSAGAPAPLLVENLGDTPSGQGRNQFPLNGWKTLTRCGYPGSGSISNVFEIRPFGRGCCRGQGDLPGSELRPGIRNPGLPGQGPYRVPTTPGASQVSFRRWAGILGHFGV